MGCKKHVTVVAATLIGVVALASALYAGTERKAPTAPRDVTLMGKVVDLQCYMTEKYSSADHVKCAQECLRNGVPAALETENGLVIIGQGLKGPARTITELALQNAELKGKLYERDGLRYIDLTSAKAATPQRGEPSEGEDYEPEDKE